ncbi:MAG TPA: DUF2059 domain-containing protein [Gemmatimonadaceae bacterium]
MSLVRSLSIAVVCGAAIAVAPCRAQDSGPIDSAKVATIHRLLELMKTPANMSSMFEASIATQRSSLPGVPASFWDAVSARAHATIPQLVDSLVPIYSRHLTQQELDQLVQFYSTPLGQHLIDVMPQIAKESMEVGARWGKQIGEQVADSIQRARQP